MRTIERLDRNTVVVALLVMSVLGFLQGSTPCDASLGSADEKLSGYELAEENDYLQLWLNRDSAEVAVLDKKSGYIWFSNPPARAEEERRCGRRGNPTKKSTCACGGGADSQGSAQRSNGVANLAHVLHPSRPEAEP